MLIEEFKNRVPELSAIYLTEQNATTLQQAASLADEFALTHRTCSPRGMGLPLTPPKSGVRPVARAPVLSSGGKLEKLHFYCHEPGHVV